MPSIIMPRRTTKDATAKDPSLRSKLGAFLSKLVASDATNGLHVEPIHGTEDPRVRTARVDASYRAVLFQVNQGENAVYVYHGIWQHDDAIAEAKRVTLRVNPHTGISEVTRITDALCDSEAAVEEARRRARERVEEARREAGEMAREAARLKAHNAETSRQIADAAERPGSDPAGSEPPAVEPSGTDAPDVGGVPGGLREVTAVRRDERPRWPEGLSIEVLRDELGIDVGLAAAALEAQHESELLDLAATSEVPWQGEMLLSLATGSTLDDVREEYEVHVPDRCGDEDEAILAGLRTRAARSVFTWAENDEDLRQAIDKLSFQQWQLFLHPQQRHLVEWDVAGPIRISGGAGTGKTVVAVHRAVWLAEGKGRGDRRGSRRGAVAGGRVALSDRPQETADARILLTTYTRNLADDLRRQVSQLAPGLTPATGLGRPGIMVNGLDAVAATVLQRAGEAIAATAEEVLGRRRTRVLAHAHADVWREVLAVSGEGLPEALRSADFLSSEYELVVLPQRVTSLRAYLRVRRPGRGVALDRAKRAEVWKAIEAYRDRTASLDVTSFSERLALAAAWLDEQARGGVPRPFRHVLVDEAQDLSPAHLQLVRALAEPGPNDIFLAEDSHQRIYGKKIVLSHYGIRVRGRSRRLTRNYRTTQENLSLAFGILEPGHYEDLEGRSEEHHYVSPRRGPEPALLRADSRSAELDAAADLLRRWMDEDEKEDLHDAAPETIAVLVRDRYQRDAVVTGLAERHLEVRPVGREAVGRGRPVVMTMHRAKGLEFRKVLLFDVSASSIPRSLRDQEYSEADRADAMLRERSLLYVAATRARDQLAVSWSGEMSPLLKDSVLGLEASGEAGPAERD